MELNSTKITLPYDEIELYKFAHTSPAVFHKHYSNMLEILKQSGVEIRQKNKPISQKLISEKDMQLLINIGSRELRISKNTIVTELAKELAIEQNICIIREK